MKQKTIGSFSIRAAIVLFALFTTVTAWADQTSVSYIDMDGNTQTVTSYTEVTSSMTGDLPGGTYVVNTDVTINGEITCDSEMNLILCDGATLTVNSSTTFNCNKLNIYSQSTGANMGKLNANGVTECIGLNIAGGKVTLNGGNNYCSLSVESGDDSGLTVNGGDITICNNNSSRLGTIYSSDNSNITMNGGKLSVTNEIANGCAIYGPLSGNATITFNGGMAEINGGINNLQNVNLNSGNVTINGQIYSRSGYTVNYDFTNPADSYYIKSFYSDKYTVNVTDGKTFTDGAKVFSGTLDADEISVISGKILKPVDFKDVRYALLDGIYHFYSYSGSPISLDYSLSYVGGTVLKKGIDYTETLSATTIKDKGYYTLTITGIGDYSGEIIYDILVGDYNIVTSTMEGGIYAVTSDVIIDEPINVNGDATIFIANGATLTANAGIAIDNGFTLTLEGNGTLSATGSNGQNGADQQTIYAHGGNGSDGKPAISGNVIVNGVTLNATGGNGGNGGQGGPSSSGRNTYGGDGGDAGNGAAAINGMLTVNGGTVNAFGGKGGNGGAVGPRRAGGHPGKNKGANGSDAPGIDGTVSYTDIAGAFAEDSNNKTEWSNLTTNSTDKQYVKAYVPTYTVTFNSNGGSTIQDCAVAEGATIAKPTIEPTRSGVEFFGWMNGNEAYDFNTPVTSDITLTAAWGITLANNEDNSTRIESANGIDDIKVALAGRTLTKDGTWNTLCLPFSLSAEQIEASPLAGAVIREMDSSTSLSDGVLTLNFKDAESIEAGKAYIVKWTTTGENITEPVFNGVSIENADLTGTESTDGNVKFVGQYSPFAIDESNINSILFIGSNNKIGYSKNPRQLKSCRAHFWVRPNGDVASARSISVDFGDGVTTSINLVEADDANTADGIYTIDGRRVKGEMMQKGVYVVKGKKVVK